jgi:BCD family chlorophyll transporter-like MFS transporter
MPFALLVLSGDTHGPVVIGQIGAALAFLLVGAGLHTTQTVGLALATDLAEPENQPRVVGLMYVMLLVGMVASALLFGVALAHFSEVRLIQVIQGAALVTMVLNGIALWKQEARDPVRTAAAVERPTFKDSWRAFSAQGHARRRLIAIGLGTAAFSMEDILLEPYGGQILHLSVGATTTLTALLAIGGLCGFGLASRVLSRGFDPYRMAAYGALVGLVAFAFVIFSEPFSSALLFGLGTALIGFGGGLFGHGTLTATMGLAPNGQTGLALGAWGAVQASAAGVAIAAGGLIRDGVSLLADHGLLSAALNNPATGYSVVYHIEIYLLFATLIAIGPLVRTASRNRTQRAVAVGLPLSGQPNSV